DEDMRYTAVKGKGLFEAEAALVGTRREELAGIDFEDPAWRGYRASVAARRPFSDFVYSRNVGGERRFISISGAPVFDASGRFTGYRGVGKDVTERRREEEELRRFRAAMDMSIDAIYLTDRASMRFVDVNEAACRAMGYTREQLLAMGPHDLVSISREDLERVYDEAIDAGVKGARSEIPYVRRDARQGWTELNRRALRADDTWIIVTISRDITERKRAEERQAAHLRHQERVARFGQTALGKREPQDLIDEAVQTVLEALTAEAVAYVESG